MDSLMLVGLVLAALYLGSCWLFPFRACWACSGRTKTGDGRGNFRMRRACWLCGGQPYRRFGARLLGRGR
ncbi:hypothetical protein I4I73_21365 [Pseudonocardia sp. KRD-184]|uniref:Uncharacterized protein n=1 Tax=Pseudonocardia oceani TaxID=2792013 RepID=A0ABS6UFZ6_9PSEU|nr:hypothetical protein [Pseudonocardia oceani]MBW0090506.1 hypothetical protein [Pseudonocardia oceani]MBW0098541.1 hypothetical protein [Pseudonocardia oceani]MBW0124381.1 hypothetical protein [Pseudonocardia oceani]MBW0131151.1 hypothetical protein [Pseudonocardia oceani]MBW0132587.1 hypothetical protein [Pseudonocardia oceani]